MYLAYALLLYGLSRCSCIFQHRSSDDLKQTSFTRDCIFLQRTLMLECC